MLRYILSINSYDFLLNSSHEVKQTLDAIESIKDQNLIIYISAYMHNTVMNHNFTKGLLELFPQAQIIKLPNKKDNPTQITIYGFSDRLKNELAEDESRSIQDYILQQTKEELQDKESELESSKKELFTRYFTDSLTNLPNLYKLRDDFEESENQALIVLMIDNFKIINDFYGFTAGDSLIEQLAARLLQEIEGIKLYRMSGSQFGIVLPKKLPFYELKNYLETLSHKLRHLFFEYHHTVIYMDITLAGVISEDMNDIFSKASMALEYAKEHRLPYWIYEDQLHLKDAYESNLKTASNIRNSIINSGIQPYFQPIIDNKSGKIVMYECLARLEDEQGQVRSPKQFLDIAKKIRVYNEVTKTIIEKSFEIFEPLPYLFSINLSMEDILSDDITSFIMQFLKNSTCASRVVFELVESSDLEDYSQLNHFIIEAKRYGAKIAIDNFGKAFSNFSFLSQMPLDFIKIDGSLMENIDNDKVAEIVVSTMVDFAKKLNIQTIAECVHSSAILGISQRLHIDFSQGFHIDEPMPKIP